MGPRGAHARACVLLTGILLFAACGVGGPNGPAYVQAADPPPHRARLYVYRSDPRTSLSTVQATVGGREIGRFRDREYETLELPAGTHLLRAGMRSIGFVVLGWNSQRVRLEPGETVYVELSVRLSARESPGGRTLEVAGRQSGSASENVFIRQRPESEARSALAATTRLPVRAAP